MWSLAGCSQKETVSLFLGDDGGHFCSYLSSLTETAIKAKEKGAVTHNSYKSQQELNESISDVLADSAVKTLAVSLIDASAGNSVVQKCAKYGAKVIFFNQKPVVQTDTDVSNAYYIGTDLETEGQEGAYALEKLFGSDPKSLNGFDKNGDGIIQAIYIKEGHRPENERKRYASFLSRLKKDGYSITVINQEECRGKEVTGKDVMASIYAQSGSMIEAAFSDSDQVTLEAADYLIEEGLFVSGRSFDKQAFPFISNGGTSTGASLLSQGLIYADIDNQASEQSEAISELAYCLEKDEDPASSLPFALTARHGYYLTPKAIF